MIARRCVGLLGLGLLLAGPVAESKDPTSSSNSVPTAARDTGSPPRTADIQFIRRGEDLYRAHCASCHGSSAINVGPVPDLRRSNPATLAALDQIVRGGVLSVRGMPSFAKVLTPADIAPLRAYLTERARLLHQ